MTATTHEDMSRSTTFQHGQAPMDTLHAALRATRRVVVGIRSDQWRLSTPCPAWTVAEVTDHVILGNRTFAAVVGGAGAPPFSGAQRPDVGRIEGDRLTAYDDAAKQLLHAFGAEGALERVVTVSFGTVPGAVALQLRLAELLVHGWDLADATAQTLQVPDAVSRGVLAFAQRAVTQLPPARSPFGAPQAAPAAAGPLEQLVALLGRTC